MFSSGLIYKGGDLLLISYIRLSVSISYVKKSVVHLSCCVRSIAKQWLWLCFFANLLSVYGYSTYNAVLSHGIICK